MINTNEFRGHTPGPWRAVPDDGNMQYRTDKLKHGGVALAGYLSERDCSPFVTCDDDVVIWPEDPDGSVTDVRYEQMVINTRLAMAAPELLAEVKELQQQLTQARECLWWCYDLARFGNEVKDEDWDFIGRLLGAETDRNDNEWGEEE